MVVQIKIVDLLPVVTGRIALDTAAKSPMRDQARAQQIAQPREVDLAVELVDADDHHQILSGIHPQPGGVDRRHPFTHRL